jgi:hypothetical protein
VLLSTPTAASDIAACEDAPMPNAYNYLEGASLVDLLLEIREEFLTRAPHDDGTGPNSLRLVATDIFEGKTTDEQLLVWRDLLDDNPMLVVGRNGDRDIFEHSDAPATYLTDLTSEIICQILYRDLSIREEDDRRSALAVDLAVDLADELDEY